MSDRWSSSRSPASAAHDDFEAEGAGCGQESGQRCTVTKLQSAESGGRSRHLPRDTCLRAPGALTGAADVAAKMLQVHATDCAQYAQSVSSPDVHQPHGDVTTVPGMHWPITEQWRQLMRTAMEREAISQSELARRVGCTSSAINRIVNGEVATSEHVEPIARVLRMPLPGRIPIAVDDIDKWLLEWRDVFPRLTARQRQMLLELARELMR